MIDPHNRHWMPATISKVPKEMCLIAKLGRNLLQCTRHNFRSLVIKWNDFFFIKKEKVGWKITQTSLSRDHCPDGFFNAT